MPLSKTKATELAPSVLSALQDAVARLGSQSAVAKDLGVSTAVVSTLLKGRYSGSVEAMEERIRGQYLAETVRCPVMGRLGRHSCLEYQTRPLVHTNPTRARLHAACQQCSNRRPK